jgi:hypothetical protein
MNAKGYNQLESLFSDRKRRRQLNYCLDFKNGCTSLTFF